MDLAFESVLPSCYFFSKKSALRKYSAFIHVVLHSTTKTQTCTGSRGLSQFPEAYGTVAICATIMLDSKQPVQGPVFYFVNFPLILKSKVTGTVMGLFILKS